MKIIRYGLFFFVLLIFAPKMLNAQNISLIVNEDKEVLSGDKNMANKPKVVFVSLGPGEPELITLKALKCLRQSEAIYCSGTSTKHDRLVSRSKDIMVDLGIDINKIVVFDVPMNSDSRDEALVAYQQTAEQIIDHLQRAKGTISVCAQGDASFYSSVYYISELLLAKGIEVERVAGIPAFVAAGTLANLHIAKQDESLRVIPGMVTYKELAKEINNGTNVVIMKMPLSEKAIKRAVESCTGAVFHYFENVGVVGKEFYTNDKDAIVNRKFPYFSLMIIQSAN